MVSPPQSRLMPPNPSLNADAHRRAFSPPAVGAHGAVQGQHRMQDQEVCGLRWEWEVEVPELGTSVLIIPGDRVKNGDDRLVVLNGSRSR